MSSKQKNIKIETENLGNLTGSLLKFSLKNEAALAIVKKLIPDLTISSQQGTGLMRYTGFTNENKSVFLGENKKLDIRILSFENNEGLQALDIFKKNIANEKENTFFDNAKVCYLKTTYVCGPPNYVKTYEELLKTFEVALEVQQKSLPKVSIEKRNLYIGGKGGTCFLSIKGNTDNDLTLRYLVIDLKVKDTSCDKFYASLIASTEVSTEILIANAILTQLNRISANSLLDYLKKSLTKDFEVNKVIVATLEKEKSTTTSGKYILRALSGIRNKMTDSKTQKESQALLLEWWLSLSTTTPKKPIPVTFVDPLLTFYINSIKSDTTKEKPLKK